jgi:hypothetical protein
LVSGFSFLEAALELTRRVRLTGFSSWLSTIVFISHFFTAKPRLQNLIEDAEGLFSCLIQAAPQD